MARWPCPPDLTEDKRCSVCGATKEKGACPGPDALVDAGSIIVTADEFALMVDHIRNPRPPSEELVELMRRRPIWERET